MKKLFFLGITGVIVWLLVQFPHIMLNPGELTFGHQNLKEKCFSCHEPFWGIAKDKCISCHKLSEIGKDSLSVNSDNKKILFHEKLVNPKCTSCHTDHKGIKPEVPISSFSHELISGVTISDCSNCHSQPADILHSKLSASCENCHNTADWKSNIQFKHDMLKDIDINNCSSCHQKPDDSYHKLSDENCNKCHSTNKWVPSSFDHSSYFRLDKNHNAKCNVCHTESNFSSSTCYGCHEHSPGNIIDKHREEGISDINNCVSCHKGGSEQDIEMNENSGKESNKSKENDRGKKNDKKHEEEDDD